MTVKSLAILTVCAAMTLSSGLAAETGTEISVETAQGAVPVPQAPDQVVVFDLSAVDTLMALGVSIDGLPAPIYLPYLEPAAKAATPVGTLFEPDFEALARMAPDLIVVGGRSAGQLAPLSRIAPTVDMSIWGTDHLDQVLARLTAYGAIFDKGAEADALADELADRIAQARRVAAGKGDGLILLTNGGKMSAYGADSRFGWLHRTLDLPEAYPGLAAETHGQAVSFEFLAEVNPDWLLVIDRGAAIGQSGEAAAATLDNRLVAGTTAAQKGQIVYLNAGPVYIAGGGVQSMMGTLDALIAAFSGADS